MHTLLDHQLRRAGIDPATGPVTPEAWTALRNVITQAYAAADADRALLERTLEVAETELRALHETARAAGEQRYQQLIENANDIIVTVGMDRVLTSINRAGERLLGYDRSELIGQSWRTLVAPEYQDMLTARAAARRAGESQTAGFTVDLVTRDGRRVPVEFTRHVLVDDGEDREVQLIGRDLSERRARERERAAADKRYAAVFEHASDVIATTSHDGRITSINQAGLDILGRRREDLIGRRWRGVEPNEIHTTHVQHSHEAATTGAPVRFETETTAPDGRLVVLDVVTWVLHRDGEPDEFVTIGRDIGERRAQERARAAAEERYAELFEHANDLVARTGLDGRITAVNRAYVELTGFAREDFIGKTWYDFIPQDHVDAFKAYLRRITRDGSLVERVEFDLLAADGRRIPIEVSTRLMLRDGAPQEFVSISRDISERRQYELHLAYLALHDALTGLPNRAQLESVLEESIEHSAHEPAVLALLDLDHFKLVNDTLGHAAGDEVLVATAQLLRRIAPGAFAARISGDEFALLLRGHELPTALAVTERLRREIESLPVQVAGERVFLSASIGIVPVAGADDPGGLMAEADAAMYAAKDGGRNRIFWSDASRGITGPLAELFRWSAGLRSAIESRRLEVHYQPVVHLETGEVAHYEALIRLRGEDGQLVYPGSFFPAAERFGLVPAIDEYVLDEVLRELPASPQLRVFVNLSAQTLSDERLLAQLVAKLQAAPGVAPRLGIEITESAAVHDIALARHWIVTLGGLGCRFALDDFGTGYNSLYQARELPVHQLKIDGSFARAVALDPRRRAVMSAVHVLAAGLGMETVAECIETEAALVAARKLGITYGQGYHLGMPAPAHEAFRELRAA
jgi:diguanylate cyclase (GGDEF)-like protein/PAS domain S-box-containing protein